jgi:hypothetical protein
MPMRAVPRSPEPACLAFTLIGPASLSNPQGSQRTSYSRCKPLTRCGAVSPALVLQAADSMTELCPGCCQLAWPVVWSGLGAELELLHTR